MNGKETIPLTITKTLSTPNGLIPFGLSIVICLASVAVANAERIDDYIQAQMAAQHIPGLSIAVVVDANVVKAQGYGLANLELGTPATADTVYELCSVTKQFVASAVLLLVQDGKLHLDDPLDRYITGTPDSWRGITIRQLLTHTAGIPDLINDTLPPATQPLDITRDFPTKDTTAEQVIRDVMNAPMNFKPGDKWSYSNTDYIILAKIVTVVSGEPWHEFLSTRVFAPLGMTSTRHHDDRQIIPNRAARYDQLSRDGETTWCNSPYLNPTYWWLGGARIVSTVRDMARWDLALRRSEILTKESIELLGKPGRLTDGSATNYGFGWFLDSYMAQPRMVHNGGISGGSSHVSHFTKSGLSVIVLANTSADLEVIAQDVCAMYDSRLSHPAILLEARAPKTVSRGKPVSITVTAHNWGIAVPEGVLKLEIRRAPFGPHDQIFEKASDPVPFATDESQTQSFEWTPDTAGEFRAYLGAFSKDWSTLHAWKNGAATMMVK